MQPTTLQECWRLAKVAVASGMLDVETPEEAMARGIYGSELGLTWFQSQRAFWTFKQGGRVHTGLWADQQKALVEAAGYEIWIAQDPREPGNDPTFAAWEGYRGKRKVRATFTREEAERTGLWDKWTAAKPIYDKGRMVGERPSLIVPEHMLVIRALTRLIKLDYADCIKGVPIVEELQDEIIEAEGQQVILPPAPDEDPLMAALRKSAEPTPEASPTEVTEAEAPAQGDEGVQAEPEAEDRTPHADELEPGPAPEEQAAGQIDAFGHKDPYEGLTEIEKVEALRRDLLDKLRGDEEALAAAWGEVGLPEVVDETDADQVQEAIRVLKGMIARAHLVWNWGLIAKDLEEMSLPYNQDFAPWSVTRAVLEGAIRNGKKRLDDKARADRQKPGGRASARGRGRR